MDISKLILFILVGLQISYDNLSEKPYCVPTKVFQQLELIGKNMITSKSYYTMKRQCIFYSHLHEKIKGIQSVISMIFQIIAMVCFLIFVCTVCYISWIKSNKMQRNKSGFVHTFSNECSDKYNFKLSLLAQHN